MVVNHSLIFLMEALLQGWSERATRPVACVTGGAVAHVLERAFRPERGPVLHAAARGAPAGGGGPARLAHVGGAGGGLHGPHPRLPGAGGEAEGPAGGHGRVLLPQVHRALHLG